MNAKAPHELGRLDINTQSIAEITTSTTKKVTGAPVSTIPISNGIVINVKAQHRPGSCSSSSS